MVATLEELTQKYSVIKEIIPGEDWVFREIDYDLFNPQYKDSVEETVKDLESELKCPYIVDHFKDHTARRRWRKTLPAEERKLIEENALRINNIVCLSQMIYILAETYNGPNKERINEEHQQIDQLLEGFDSTIYDQMTSQEKITFVQRIKRHAYAVLESLAEESVKQQKETQKP
jgi:hypothetical protein